MGQIIALAHRPAAEAAADSRSEWLTAQRRLKAIADDLEAFCTGLDSPIAEARASLDDHRRALACYRADGTVDPDAYAAYVAARRRA
jgi:hypothetical protein